MVHKFAREFVRQVHVFAGGTNTLLHRHPDLVTVFFNLVKKTKNQSKQAQAKSQKRETYSEQKRTKDVRA